MMTEQPTNGTMYVRDDDDEIIAVVTSDPHRAEAVYFTQINLAAGTWVRRRWMVEAFQDSFSVAPDEVRIG